MKSTILKTLIPLALIAQISADEIKEEIAIALSAYEAGEYSNASAALQQANALMGEKKATSIGNALPDKIGGWTGGEIENESAGMSLMGGGVMLARTYSQADKKVKIQLMADSPMVTQLMGMMSNPAMAAGMGMKMKRVGDQKAFYNKDSGGLSMIVQNKYLIQIENSEATEDELIDLVKGIDLEYLKNFR